MNLEKIRRLAYFCKEISGIRNREVYETIVQKPHIIYQEAMQAYYLFKGCELEDTVIEEKYRELLRNIPIFDLTTDIRSYSYLYNNYFLASLYDKFLQVKKGGMKYAVMSVSNTGHPVITQLADIKEHEDKYKYVTEDNILKLPERTISLLVDYGTLYVSKSIIKPHCVELMVLKSRIPYSVNKALRYFQFSRFGSGKWRGRFNRKDLLYIIRLCKSFGMEVEFGKKQA